MHVRPWENILIFNHDLDLEIQAHETSHWLQAVFLQSLRPGDETCLNIEHAKQGISFLTLLWTTKMQMIWPRLSCSRLLNSQSKRLVV